MKKVLSISCAYVYGPSGPPGSGCMIQRGNSNARKDLPEVGFNAKLGV
jgi:hypothetical protein